MTAEMSGGQAAGQAAPVAPAIRGVLFDLGGTLLHQGERSPRSLWAAGLGGVAAALAGLAGRGGKDQAVLARELQVFLEQGFPAFHREGREADLGDMLGRYACSVGVARETGEQALETVKLAKDLLTAMHRPWGQCAVQMPGAAELLAALRAQGMRVGVLSNSIFPSSHLAFEAETAGLNGHFDFLISSADLGWRKPHPRAFAAALERMGLGAGEVVFVGDRLLLDIKGARGAGMRAVLLGPATDAAEAAAAIQAGADPEAVTADAEIKHLAELLGLLKVWR